MGTWPAARRAPLRVHRLDWHTAGTHACTHTQLESRATHDGMTHGSRHGGARVPTSNCAPGSLEAASRPWSTEAATCARGGAWLGCAVAVQSRRRPGQRGVTGGPTATRQAELSRGLRNS